MWSFFKNWIIPLGTGLLISFWLSSNFGLANVSGKSMEPTLFSKEQMVFQRHAAIKRFDVIIFNAGNVDPKDTTDDDYVKRVIGLPGDEITYQADGTLLINGKEYKQPFISQESRSDDTITIEQHTYNQGFTLQDLSQKENWTHKMSTNKIPANQYFVMGDNRAVSNDSRYWGLVPSNKIKGVAKWTSSFRTIK